MFAVAILTCHNRQVCSSGTVVEHLRERLRVRRKADLFVIFCAECCYAERGIFNCYAECRYADHHIFIVMLSAIIIKLVC